MNTQAYTDEQYISLNYIPWISSFSYGEYGRQVAQW